MIDETLQLDLAEKVLKKFLPAEMHEEIEDSMRNAQCVMRNEDSMRNAQCEMRNEFDFNCALRITNYALFYRVIAALAEGIATQNSFKREPTSTKCPVFF